VSERTIAFIDSDALHNNLAVIKRIAPSSRVLAMVKANAYGHGLIPIGNILKNVDGFGVACLDEAIKLRESGISQPIVIMSGSFTKKDLILVQNFDLQIVVYNWIQIKLLESTTLNRPLFVWLMLDTGMHRLGFPPEECLKAYYYLANSPKINKPIVLMTHLANADNRLNPMTTDQIDSFLQFSDSLPCLKSIANSAGILAWPSAIADWNRPGIMLYGISPLIGNSGNDHGLIPVMTLMSKIIAIHELRQGDAIGYGSTWVCPENMRVGVVAIGYGDGYPRHARNGTPTLIKNSICPLVGRVSMDLITVDLRSCKEAEVGDDVILWGNGLPAEIVANYADTIAYELICHVTQRVVFVYR
jgi:alanine racemase